MPRALRAGKMPPMAVTVKGVGAAPGIGVGKIVYFDDSPRFIPTRKISPEEVEGEVRRFRSALKQAEKDLRILRRQVAQTLSRQDTAIFDAQISILKDPVFINDVRELIFTEKINVEQALQKVIAKYEKAFDEVLDPAFRERAADIRDVGNRVFMVLLKRKRGRVRLQERFVHAALDFLPSRAGDLDREHCAAIVTERGGKYSHGAILARSLGIPAVVGVDDLYGKIPEGAVVAVDGDAGLVYMDLDDQEIREWKERESQFREVEARLAGLRARPARTRDGKRITLQVNIEGVRDLDAVDMDTVDGVGLFRTEFAFMERRNFPSEEEQYEIYVETLRRAGGKRVVFRTLDIGGDKPLEYFRTPQES
ncbi:MAG TPA: phosphoenolpyruvate--protein phosphotransferase, partial [Planctomycetes bacterium]|nr:phosphoenolpyruvate--protein phosphotransferase [Planctomycetota bacterium]